MTYCGIGKVAVNLAWKARYPFGTDLDGRFVYLREGDRQWLLAAFDFSYMFRRSSLAWRQAVAAETGIPMENIWVHETQNHSAPIALDLDGEPSLRLAELCLPEIRRLIGAAEEAEVSMVMADLGDRFNMTREQCIPGLGNVTVWQGCEFDEQGRPFARDASIMLLADWQPNLPAFRKPIYFDRPPDPQAALLVFRGRKGNILGSLSRFAAHADIVGACVCKDGGEAKEYKYHFDWPGYMRLAMEEVFGGVGVTVVGPCGNLSTRKIWLAGYAAGDRQAREIGRGIAEKCVEQYNASRPEWRPLRLLASAHTAVELPLRDTFPRSRAELLRAPEKAAAYKEEYQAAIRAGANPYRIRELIDLWHHWTWAPNIAERWAGLSEDELERGVIKVELEAIRLNDIVLAGLPGESMHETGQWLRAQSFGNRLVTIDQLNGYCAYQTTREQFDHGGYGYACSCLARDAESVTRREALALIRRVS